MYVVVVVVVHTLHTAAAIQHSCGRAQNLQGSSQFVHACRRVVVVNATLRGGHGKKR